MRYSEQYRNRPSFIFLERRCLNFPHTSVADTMNTVALDADAERVLLSHRTALPPKNNEKVVFLLRAPLSNDRT